jgi:phosphoribosylformimino-5-aminoimidazole carboxamide ribotide isomerase
MPPSFEIIPAIDLRAGLVVRLREGDFARQTIYADDPALVAAAFAAAGARWLHVVDLEGARAGRPTALETIRLMRSVVGDRLAIEVAGGLRRELDVEDALVAGADRVVLGTAFLKSPDLALRLVRRFGAERLVAAIDVRGDLAMGDAWLASSRSGRPVEEVATELARAGVQTFEVTAIERDGGLQGPDLELVGRVLRLDLGDVVASAGVRDLADLRSLQAAGCAGAIVGRAVYEGRLDLATAIRALRPGG